MTGIFYKIWSKQKHYFLERKKLTQIPWNIRDKRQLFLFGKVLKNEGIILKINFFK